jgi:hypothetical protein
LGSSDRYRPCESVGRATPGQKRLSIFRSNLVSAVISECNSDAAAVDPFRPGWNHHITRQRPWRGAPGCRNSSRASTPTDAASIPPNAVVGGDLLSRTVENGNTSVDQLARPPPVHQGGAGWSVYPNWLSIWWPNRYTWLPITRATGLSAIRAVNESGHRNPPCSGTWALTLAVRGPLTNGFQRQSTRFQFRRQVYTTYAVTNLSPAAGGGQAPAFDPRSSPQNRVIRR